jgi:hypothetical protein
MNENRNPRTRKSYEPPTVSRVHMDPVREMLNSCSVQFGSDGKADQSCNVTGS